MVIDSHGICSMNWFKKIQVGWEEVAHRQVKGCINCALPSMFSYFTFILAISMEQKNIQLHFSIASKIQAHI